MNRKTPAGAIRCDRNPFSGCFRIWLAIVIAQALFLGVCHALPPTPIGQRVIQPFDFKGVTLLPGPLKTQLDQVRQFYLAIPDNDLLKGFRKRAGLPAPGQDLGGWYSADLFCIFGQIVSGLARLSAATGDAACSSKANRLIAEWAKCIESDGYFYASRRPNAPHYIYDKMLWGLLDTYVYCGNTQSLTHLSRITDWAIKNLPHPGRVNDIGTEWYTLSENLYRAYLLTGDVKYRDFAQSWEYHQFWDIYLRGGDIFGTQPDGSRNTNYHAYSHVNSLGGAAAAYWIKGNAEYLTLLINAAEDLRGRHCFPSGGYGPNEQLLPREQLVAKLATSHSSFETQCGSWAVFKLAKYLLSFTGDANYGDWVERLVYNGIGASIPMSTNGCVLYFSDYSLYGGLKENSNQGWTCCAGTRPQAIADYCDLIYFHDARDLYINLFTPSTVTWTNAQGRLTLTQSTTFPESEQVRVTLSLSQPATFALKLRVPRWLAGPMVVTVNGRPATPNIDENDWATLDRLWNNGDEIKLVLPMDFWNSTLDPQGSPPIFSLYGPVLMALEAPTAQAVSRIRVANLSHTTVPVLNRPLWFTLTADSNIRVRPFYSFREGELYYPCWDTKTGAYIPHETVEFSGRWWETGLFRDSNQIGDTAECTFEGTGIRWLGRRFDDGGFAEVTIDRKAVSTVSQYGPGRELPFDWAIRGLPSGVHTIRLRVLSPKPPNSRDRYLNLIGFEVLK